MRAACACLVSCCVPRCLCACLHVSGNAKMIHHLGIAEDLRLDRSSKPMKKFPFSPVRCNYFSSLRRASDTLKISAFTIKEVECFFRGSGGRGGAPLGLERS